MRIIFKKLVCVCFISVGVLHSYAQEFSWNAGYEFIGENREYTRTYGFPQTILDSRASLELGFLLDSSNAVMLGGHYTVVHGDDHFSRPPILTMYYRYTHEFARLHFGSFPRERQYFPLFMLTDSLSYARPNIEGGLLEFFSCFARQSILLDWTIQQNAGEHEQFLAGTFGTMSFKSFFLQNHFYYYHEAYSVPTGGKQVIDNGVVHLAFGVDASDVTILDSLSVSIGGMFNWYTFRPLNTQYAQGILCNVHIFHSIFGLESVLYIGDAPHIVFGDPLYRSKEYARFNAVFAPKFHPSVEAAFKFCTHHVAGEINYSQQLFIRAIINK